ncbi:fungal-specific transcription factor domain-containing protein [Mycena galopus ATCC 62051]|nr:fungal-specific transcription factor domain-containing protein [Mycena galopus ATCC 62051]
MIRAALNNLCSPPSAPTPMTCMTSRLQRRFETLSVSDPGQSFKFFGKSSAAMLVNAALDLKMDPNANRKEAEGHPSLASQSVNEQNRENDKDPKRWTSRRLQYWTWKPMDGTPRRLGTFEFPHSTLMSDFIDLYFTRENIYLPLLHRPTFERGVAEGLHLRDQGFAGTVLLLCAIASRHSTDPGIAAAGLDCGWEWFNQVPLAGNRLFEQTTLYDLQHYCLAAQFLKGSTMPHAWWTLVGIGLRLAQDIGVHRQKTHNEVPSVETELYKRAFYVLVYLDRISSCILGRTCTVNYDDFDVDSPIECDDEYWEHPTHPFEQPAGVPSRVTFFNTIMHLNHIMSCALRILYTIQKIPALCPFNDSWLEEVIAELDSALNKWRDRIPDHLRWDPMRKDPIFFDQSVALSCAYYHCQILIHRPFIPMVRKSAPTALPSLAVCTSAARACAHVVETQRRRTGNVTCTLNLHAIFTSGLVLVLNVLSGKRSGVQQDTTREMANVHRCMELLRLYEARDLLTELTSVGQLPLPNLHPTAGAQLAQLSMNRSRGPPGDYPPVTGDGSSIFHDSHGLSQTFHLPTQFQFQFHAPYMPMLPPPFAGSVTANRGLLGDGSTPLGTNSFTPMPAPFQPEDVLYPDPAQASRELESMIDSEMLAVWTGAPMSLGVDDWEAYFSNFSDM